MNDRWYLRQGDGERWPIAGFDDDGHPLVSFEYGAPEPHYVHPVHDEVLRAGVPIPADPGWYVVFVSTTGQGDLHVSRRPVIAWEVADMGDAYVVNDMRLDEGSPVVRACAPHALLAMDPYAVYHRVYQPEEGNFEADALAWAEDLRRERIEAAEKRRQRREAAR